jgi:hypothetical protein
MYAFTLERPATLADAKRLAAAGAKPLAGGQTLLASMKLRLSSPEQLADLSGIKELVGTAENQDFSTYLVQEGELFMRNLVHDNAGEGISAIIARIEAFRRARAVPAGARLQSGDLSATVQSHLPFADEVHAPPPAVTAVDITLDADGTVIAAQAALAAALVGLRPFAADPDAPVSCDPATLSAARARLLLAPCHSIKACVHVIT